MFCINVILTVNDGEDVAEIRSFLKEVARLSRLETGCIRFEVYHSRTSPNTFILNERWESEQAWIAHRNEPAFKDIYAPLVLPRVTRTPHVSELVES